MSRREFGPTWCSIRSPASRSRPVCASISTPPTALRAVGIDPRIAARFEVTSKLAILHALGIAHQPPSFVVPIPGFQPGGLQGGLQKSLQASSGVELQLPEDFIATVTLFNNVFLT